MLKELREDLKNIKKVQSEMKGTIIEIKNNLGKQLQGNKSRVDETENQINAWEHKEGKNQMSILFSSHAPSHKNFETCPLLFGSHEFLIHFSP